MDGWAGPWQSPNTAAALTATRFAPIGSQRKAWSSIDPGPWSSFPAWKFPAGKRVRCVPASDLLTCGILMWGRTWALGLASDRVDESQLGARIGELGRVEVLQQVRDRSVGPRVRHRMDLHAQDPLLEIG